MADVLEQLRIFCQVATLRSFTKAALALGVPKTSVSEAIQKLEARQGVRLLQRTTRSVQLTHDGQLFLGRCQQLLADADELADLFTPDHALSGTLRVDMPLAFARHAVLPQLAAFLQAHPQLTLQLSCSDRFVDVVHEGFDAVIRVGQLPDSTLVARKLGELAQMNVASPAYLAQYGTPTTLAELAGHQLVGYSPGLANVPQQFCYQAGGQSMALEMPTRLIVNNTESYQQACVQGFGIIQAPRYGLQTLLSQGLLVELMPDYQAAPLPVHVLYPHRHGVSRRLRAFIEFLAPLLQLQPPA